MHTRDLPAPVIRALEKGTTVTATLPETTRLLPIHELHPADDNLRTKLTGIDELAASITSIGILQPLVVTRREEGGWTVIAGNRRRAAAEQAGLAEVSCTVVDLDGQERTIAMAVENLQREDLTPLEEADAYQRLATAGLSQRDIAARIGRSQPHVSRRLGLLDLPEIARAKLDAGRITVETAVELGKLAKEPKRLEKVVKMLDDPWRSESSIPNKVKEELDAAARERKRDKVAKPLLTAGVKCLGQPNYMKYDGCDRAQATVFWFSWDDQVVFGKEKPQPKAAANGTTPAKETKKQREAREAAEAAAARHAARAKVLDGPPTLELLAAVLVEDELEFGDELEDVGPILGLDFPETVGPQVVLATYVGQSSHHLQRAATAIALLRADRANGHGRMILPPVALRLLADAGLELTDDEQKVLSDAGQHPDDVPSGKAAIAATIADGADFAAAHDLQPGDEVHDDGSIEREHDDWDDLRDQIRTDDEADA